MYMISLSWMWEFFLHKRVDIGIKCLFIKMALKCWSGHKMLLLNRDRDVWIKCLHTFKPGTDVGIKCFFLNVARRWEQNTYLRIWFWCGYEIFLHNRRTFTLTHFAHFGKDRLDLLSMHLRSNSLDNLRHDSPYLHWKSKSIHGSNPL